MVKNSPAMQDLIPGSGRSPEEGWLPTRVFLPGEFYGQRSLVGFSPWGHKESDRTEGTEQHREAQEAEKHVYL